MTNRSDSLIFTENLIKYINDSPSAYHSVENALSILEAAGFTKLDSCERFSIAPGGKYYLTRGGSSLIALIIPEDVSKISFTIGAIHGDSPCFKLKPRCESDAFGKYGKLTVEKYGGAILQSWFDRPLSVAGRIVIEEDGKLISKNVNVDRDLLIIPNVPIHLGNIKEPTPLTDFLPLFSEKESGIGLFDIIAEQANISPEKIISSDLFVYNRQKGVVFGAKNEFFSAPRIDDLECAYALLEGFIEAEPASSVAVYAMFDNEETGSSSRQGAASTFLPETLLRTVLALGGSHEDYYAALASSFMLSADNAHAKHPNHPELYDALNAPNMNGGIVIKTNSTQKYTTDAVSFAIVKKICEKAGVPCQNYANRADLPGGSTLGNIALHQLPVCCADIGLAQLAMHSSYETAGTDDALYLKKASKVLFETKFTAQSDFGYLAD